VSSGDDSYISVPKKKAGIFIPIAALTIAGSMFGAFKSVMEYIDNRQQRAIEEKQRQQNIEQRLDKLERYQCVLGWDPPSTKNPDRKCE
jgi:glutaredoxin 2